LAGPLSLSLKASTRKRRSKPQRPQAERKQCLGG